MSTTAVIVGALAAVVVAVLVAVAARRRSPHSSVDSFRRQIDALGPAARRTVVDQVQQTAANRDPDPIAPDSTAGGAADPADPTGEPGEGGDRGA